MVLDPRNPSPEAREIALMAYRVTLQMLTADGGVQAYGAGDGGSSDTSRRELIQASELDHAGHFGFWSAPPKETEGIVVRCGADSDVQVAERCERPAALANAGSGESALYDADGNLIWMRGANGIEIRPKSGQKCVVKSDGGTAEAVALAPDVESEISALRDWCRDHQHVETGGSTDTARPAPPAVGSVGADILEAE